MSKTTWVVVADEAIARILSWPDKGSELQPVQEITDPDAHAKGRDLRDDAYGRRAGNDGRAAGHQLRGTATATAGAGLDETHLQAERFARQVTQWLADAQHQGRFHELHIIAAPRFLGLLRKNLPRAVQGLVGQELDKDLVHATSRELSDRLFPDGSANRRPGMG